jgi:hypothetical protein
VPGMKLYTPKMLEMEDGFEQVQQRDQHGYGITTNLYLSDFFVLKVPFEE